jgi:quinolinate synthase
VPEIEWATVQPLIEDIERLKIERNAVVIGHNYMTPDIFHGVADLRGDSLEMARMASEAEADVIVVAGVHFMAETAKIVSPDKTVLIPDLGAGCSLAESITGEDVRQLRARYPGVPVVTYVNTSADVKAESDVCCTSSNAVQVVESLGVDRVIFLPDRYLGQYVAGQTDTEVILWDGTCIVHERFSGAEVRGVRATTPGVSVIAHPECPPDVLAEADFVGSTSAMINWVADHQPPTVMMVTECSMSDNVAVEHPEVEFIRPCNLCPYMKTITLENIRRSLQTMQHPVEVAPDVAARAREAVDRMLAVTGGAAVRVEAVLVTSGRLAEQSSTARAQGGIAAAIGPDDSPAQHASDTLNVSAGIGVPDAIERLAGEARDRVEWLAGQGVVFDRAAGGELALGMEAGHLRRRVVHANGDATGAEIARGMTEAVRRREAITTLEDVQAIDLATEQGRVAGLVVRHTDGSHTLLLAPAVVLATGGIGQVYARTTNPQAVYGSGIAMAARAGAHLIDLEFVQFHPTALDTGADPLPLLTEALRGEGAVLVDHEGRRFMADLHPDAELAPRDVVARAIFQRRLAGPVSLDARCIGPDFPERFPTAFAHAQLLGLDPRHDLLPVTPAQHFFMGGVAVDGEGRSSRLGLWAVGEVSSTGVHGANRLASNSLLEGLVFGAAAARSIAADLRAGVLSSPAPTAGVVEVPDAVPGDEHPVAVEADLRNLMWAKVGLVRDGADLRRAIGRLRRWSTQAGTSSSRIRDMLLVSRLVAEAALARRESRGAHYRRDWRETNPILARRRTMIPRPAGTVALATEKAGERLVPV